MRLRDLRLTGTVMAFTRWLCVGRWRFLFLPLVIAPPLHAENILVMAADAHPDAVRRDSTISAGVLAAIQAQMIEAGHWVFDEDAIGVGQFAPGRNRRRTDELIDIARLLKDSTPIDAVVLFSVFSSHSPTPYHNRVSLRIQAQLLDVQGGHILGNPESVEGKVFALIGASETDVANSVTAKARPLAEELGKRLAKGLRKRLTAKPDDGPARDADCPSRPRRYVLVLDNFTDEKIAEVGNAIAAFSCYVSHRVIERGLTHAKYSYWSSIDNQGLSRILDGLRLGLAERAEDERFTMHVDGTTFTISRVVLRR